MDIISYEQKRLTIPWFTVSPCGCDAAICREISTRSVSQLLSLWPYHLRNSVSGITLWAEKINLHARAHSLRSHCVSHDEGNFLRSANYKTGGLYVADGAISNSLARLRRENSSQILKIFRRVCGSVDG